MPFHIDTDGTRRQYTQEVVQGLGGGGSSTGGGSSGGGGLTSSDISQLIADAIAEHEAKSNPHSQYLNSVPDCEIYYMSQI